MYDLAIIGGGPAGYSAAFEAVRHGLSTVLFEKDKLGGTCLNRGCVPTKYLSHVAREYCEADRRKEEGILFSKLGIDFSRTVERMREIISLQRDGLEGELLREKVLIVQGETCIDAYKNVVCEGKVYVAANILIATGSESAPKIIEHSITSDELLELGMIPKKLHIMGGGTVAVEFAEIFRMLGSEVTISIRGDRILRKWDREIAIGFTQSMKRKGICIQNKCDFGHLDIGSGTTIVSAIGRQPVIPYVENDFFEVGAHGGIIVDEFGQTETKGIYAAGDVVEGSPQLAHTGMEQGRRVVRHIVGLELPKESAIVRCIYPYQEAASVGLNEAEAKEKGVDIVSAKQNMYSNARTAISTNERGFIKILAEKGSGKVVGAHLMCERAGDIVAELVLAVNQGITVREMIRSVRPHPSYCEAIMDVLRVLEDKLREIQVYNR